MEQKIKISLINCIKFVRMFHLDCLYFKSFLYICQMFLDWRILKSSTKRTNNSERNSYNNIKTMV